MGLPGTGGRIVPTRPERRARWWARLLGHELLRVGPRATEVAEAVCRAARRFGTDGRLGEPALPLLAVAGLVAVSVSARPDGTREDAEAAWAALDRARGECRSPLAPGAVS